MPASIDGSLHISEEPVSVRTTTKNQNPCVRAKGSRWTPGGNNENRSAKASSLAPEPHLPTVAVSRSEIPSPQVKDTARIDSASLWKMLSSRSATTPVQNFTPREPSFPYVNTGGSTYGSNSEALYLSNWSMQDPAFEQSPHQTTDDFAASFGRGPGSQEYSTNLLGSLVVPTPVTLTSLGVSVWSWAL
jgi:hypothetical protein